MIAKKAFLFEDPANAVNFIAAFTKTLEGREFSVDAPCTDDVSREQLHVIRRLEDGNEIGLMRTRAATVDGVRVGIEIKSHVTAAELTEALRADVKAHKGYSAGTRAKGG